MTALCAKHRAEFEDWSDWGPYRPLPRGLTRATVDSQLALIKQACREGRGCERGGTDSDR